MFSLNLSFLEFIKSQEISESMRIGDYASKNADFENAKLQLLRNKEVQSFLNQVDNHNLITPKLNATGVLVTSKSQSPSFGFLTVNASNSTGTPSQHRIPVRFLKIEEDEAELERIDGKNFDELTYKVPQFPDPKTKKTIVVPLSRISVHKPEPFTNYLDWLTYAFLQESQNSNSNFNQLVNSLFPKIKENLLSSLDNQQIQSQLRTTNLTLKDFVSEYPDVKKFKGGIGASGRVVVEFPNGFKWIALDRESCRQEGDAAGHCGNTADAKTGDNVLSLRDQDDKVYLTFILKTNGYLGERKANGNKKPNQRFHPYIIELLKNPIIKNLGEGSYLKENDFQLTDLNTESMLKLATIKPELFKNFSKLDLQLIKIKDNQNQISKLLKNKFPNLQQVDIKAYTPEKSAIIIDDEIAINYDEKIDWKKSIYSIITETNDIKIFQFEDQPILHAIPELTSKNISDILNYVNNIKKRPVKSNQFINHLSAYTDGLTPNNAAKEKYSDFLNLLETLIHYDSKFKNIIKEANYKSYVKSNVEFINQELFETESSDGTFYQLQLYSRHPYLIKMLKINEAHDYDPSIQNPEYHPRIRKIGPRVDYFVEALDLKNLFY